jgi:hypothetical protein
MKIELTFFPIDVEFIKRYVHNTIPLAFLDAKGRIFVPSIWNKTYAEIEKFFKEEQYTHFAFGSVHQQMLIDKFMPSTKPETKTALPPRKEKK